MSPETVGRATPRRAAVVGTGLVGGSVGLALSARGVEVAGFDTDRRCLERALERGAIGRTTSSVGEASEGADLVVVAVPVSAIAPVVVEALDAGARIVTDVGSVKAPVVAEIEKARPGAFARFVGGHPMAGSEQDGVEAADGDLFLGATWVLTPTPATDEQAYTELRAAIRLLGAEVISVTPAHHDVLVALVSHVPQLVASTLMDVANAREAEHRVLLRLAAGGFRDMTRIAAGHPGIWPDILGANRDAVLEALDSYLEALRDVRSLVAGGDRSGILDLLERARRARRNLPVGSARADELVELRVPIPDRPGALADVTTLAGGLGVNVVDVEIAHSLEGGAGVVVMVVARADVEAFVRALHERGYHTARSVLP